MIDPTKAYKNTGLETEIEKLIDTCLSLEWDEDEIERKIEIKALEARLEMASLYFFAKHFAQKYKIAGWQVSLAGGPDIGTVRGERSFGASFLIFSRPMIEHSGKVKRHD